MKTNKLLKIFFSLFAIAAIFSSCVQDKEFDTPQITCTEPDVAVNATIADVKALYNGNVREITEDLVIEGYVISNDEAGNFYRTLHFQDDLENPTIGLQLDVDLQDMYATYQVGRKIYLKLQGLYIDDYNGVIKVGGLYEQSGGDLAVGRLSALEAESRLFRACAEPMPVTPKTVALDAITDDMINTLIKLENVEIAPASLCQTYAVEAENTNVYVKDCNGNEIIMRNSGYSSFYNQPLPTGNGTLVAVLSKYGSDYQLTIRDTNDVEMNNPRCDGATFTCEPPTPNATIQDIKDAYTGDLTQIDQNLVVEAVVTANDESGNFYKFVYIEDETGGIRLRINQRDLYLRGYEVGQKIIVAAEELYIDNSNGELHLGGLYNGGIGAIEEDVIYKHLFVLEETATLEPTVITLDQLSDDDLGKLVKIENVQFVEENQTFVVNGRDTNTTITDCEGNRIILRTSRFANFKDASLPTGNGPIYAILSKYRTDYQLWIRDLDDVDEMTDAKCDIFASAVETTIEEVRAMFTGSETTVDGNLKIKAVITSDNSTGNLFSSNAFAQDATAGIALRFTDDHNLNLGDEVEIALMGVDLEEYNGLLQLNNIPVGNIRSTTAGTLPTPMVITLEQALTGDYEGQLVQINDVQFKSITGNYSGSNTITNCTEELDVYVRSSATFADNTINVLNGAITGVMSDFNGPQLYIRDTSDINFTNDYVNCSGGGGSTTAANIYFSEYAEGSSNNKYLEIYNASTEVVELDNYAFPSVSNAPSTPGEHEFWNTFTSGATIQPGEVYIIAHPSADAEILAKANQTHQYLSNGNDGYALAYGTETEHTIIDRIGDFQSDVTAWDVAGVTNGTQNHTLVRKATVTEGNPDWSASAGTNADDSEWIVLDIDVWTSLGVR